MGKFWKIAWVHLTVVLVSAVMLVPLLLLVILDIWFWNKVYFLGITEVLMVTLVIGAVYHFVSMIWFLVFSLKHLASVDRYAVKEEVNDPSSIWWKRARICLTPDYIVYASRSIYVLPYSRLAWAYVTNRFRFREQLDCIQLCTKDGKRFVTRGIDVFKSEQLEEILFVIHQNHPEIMVGFNYENKEKYKGEVLKNG